MSVRGWSEAGAAREAGAAECACCGRQLVEPYVECCECADVDLCTACYSTGRETDKHKSYHDYAFRRNDFPLFEDCNWTAQEEMKLLNGLSSHGYGNWEEVSKYMQTRTQRECEDHYNKYYIDNVQREELNIVPATLQSMFPRPVIPFLYKGPCEDPPRYTNYSNHNLAGYNAFRSDFALHYDNTAEKLLSIASDLVEDDEDDECIQSLKLAVVTAYNNRLRERLRRYTIIKHHGLIVSHKLISWIQRFYDTLGRKTADRLPTFMQFFTGMQFDIFMEQINLEAELCQKICKLGDYRKNGIKTLYGARMYEKLKKSDELHVKEQKFHTSIMKKTFQNETVAENVTQTTTTRTGKKPPPPMDVVDLPGYHLLSESERELCSRARVPPQVYLDVKHQLIVENNKMGSLRLLDARRIIKIDVNKTRRIYDHLIAEGFIKKPL